jgi:hypothetical protein
VVVNDEGDAVAGAVERGGQGREQDQLGVEGAVKLPPDMLQPLLEIGGRLLRARAE